MAGARAVAKVSDECRHRRARPAQRSDFIDVGQGRFNVPDARCVGGRDQEGCGGWNSGLGADDGLRARRWPFTRSVRHPQCRLPRERHSEHYAEREGDMGTS